MSHWVAVEWDDRTLRVLCVRPSAGTLTIEHRFSLPLPEVDGEASSPAGLPAAFLPRLAGALAPALAERGIRRGELLVAMGRSGVELRTIEVPVVPEDELPDLVRMQASQVFHPSIAPLPIDYVPIDFGEEKIAVLAASIAPDVYEGLKGLAEALKLKLGCVTLRTVSAARLLAYCGRHPGESLVICRSQEQVDLVAMLEGRPVFVRNTRIPGESIDAGLALEVRRTLLAIASRHSDENVDRLVLWGSEAESGGIAQTLRERLSMEVEVLDPFKAEDVQAPGLPSVDDAGAYASLVGMLCEHRRPPHAIDFHNPKRRVEPPKISPRMMLYAGAGAAFALILVSVFGWRFWSLTSEIAALETDVKKLETLQKKADEVVSRAEWVRTWTEDDYVWLEELRVVSERMPPPDKALVRSWVSSSDADGNGSIRLEILVDDPQTIADAESRHRDERRRVEAGGGDTNDTVPGYGYLTRATISMKDPVPPNAEAAESDDLPTLEPRAAGSPIDPLSEEATDPVDEVEAMLAEEEAAGAASAAAPTAPEDSTGPEGPTAGEPNDGASPPSDGNASEENASEENADEPAGDAPPESDAPLDSSAAPSSTPSSTGAGR